MIVDIGKREMGCLNQGIIFRIIHIGKCLEIHVLFIKNHSQIT